MAAPSRLRSARGEERRIHVLQVLGNAIAGGMENYVLRLIERLPRERFTTTALCPFESDYTERLRRLDVEVLVTPMPIDTLPWCSLQLAAELVRGGAVDVLHAHLPNAHLLAGLTGLLSGRPVLATIHGRQLTVLDLEVHRSTGSHLNVVCKQSYFHALGLGINASQLSCIPNGIDSAMFAPLRAGETRGDLRRSLGVPDGAPLVGFVGRLHWEKGPDVFVQAALLLADEFPAAHFILVGDGPMRGQLEEFIGRFSLAGRVHLAGIREAMPAVYRDLDALVSCSYSEAMPLAVMEAMASGLPVVATAVGGVPDLIEQERTGFLVDPGDARAIAAQVGRLLAAPPLREGLGRQARRFAVERLELKNGIEEMARLYVQLAGSRQGGGRRMGALLPGTPSA